MEVGETLASVVKVRIGMALTVKHCQSSNEEVQIGLGRIV